MCDDDLMMDACVAEAEIAMAPPMDGCGACAEIAMAMPSPPMSEANECVGLAAPMQALELARCASDDAAPMEALAALRCVSEMEPMEAMALASAASAPRSSAASAAECAAPADACVLEDTPALLPAPDDPLEVPGGPRVDASAYVAGVEQVYLEKLRAAAANGTWDTVYGELRKQNKTSPSFFIYAAGVRLESNPPDAVRIVTNCLEMKMEDVQMLRSVAYFVLKAGATRFALAIFDHVRDLAPVEPTSFLDSALARFFTVRSTFDAGMLKAAIGYAHHAIMHVWAERFHEVEWPALILLHMLCEVGEDRGLTDLWPLAAEQRVPDFHIGLMVWLAWDTDNTDIDLHVMEPSGNEIYYGNKNSRDGGHLSKDFTRGYGPEVYIIKDPPVGSYTVMTKYFSSSQQSALTGATSAVVWALKGNARAGQVQFDTVRLDTNKQKVTVMSVAIEPVAKPILECFRNWDTANSGVIDRPTLKSVLQELDADTWTDDNVDALLKEMDLNKDGVVDYTELVTWITQKEVLQK